MDRDHFRIGDWAVDPAAGRITCGSDARTLRPREMDVLIVLARAAGEVVTTDELLERVWRGVVVGTDSVYYTVSQLRKALGDERDAPRYLETLPRRGYRLIADVDVLAPETPADVAPPAAGTPAAGTPAAGPPPASPRPPPRRPSWMLPTAAAALVAILLLVLVLRPEAPGDAAAPNADDGMAIAVLPFVDPGGAQARDYLAEGIAEELRARLARVPGLRVASRFSSEQMGPDAVGRAALRDRLGVDGFLEGSVRRDGERLRISASLVDSATGFQLWSETFEARLGDMLRVQDRIGRAVTRALQIEFLAAAPAPGPVDPRAYDLYLRGLQGLHRNDYASLRDADDDLAAAVALDAGFADALAARARVLHTLHLTGARTGDGVLDEAETLAQRALELDPTLARARVVLGRIADARGRPDLASAHLEAAVELAPGDGEMLAELAKVLGHGGRHDEAGALIDRALRADALNPAVHRVASAHALVSGDLDAARAALDRAIALNPEDPNLHWFVGRIELERGRLADAVGALEQAARIDTLDYEIAAHLALAYLELGLDESADRWARRAVELGPASLFARLPAILARLAGSERDAAIVEGRVLLGEAGLRDSHSAAALLRTALVRALVAGAELDSAYRLITSAPALGAYLAGPPANTPDGLSRAGVSPDELLVFGEILRREGDAERLPAVIAHAAPAGLAGAVGFRDRPRVPDLLVEAQLDALRGDAEGAVARLAAANARGFRSVLTLSSIVDAFALHETRGLDALVARIEAERAREVTRVRLLLARR